MKYLNNNQHKRRGDKNIVSSELYGDGKIVQHALRGNQLFAIRSLDQAKEKIRGGEG